MLSLHEANELLKQGYPPIPEEVHNYLKDHHALPRIFCELPIDRDRSSADKAAELDGQLAELPEELQGFMTELAEFLDHFPYSNQLKLLWCNSRDYWSHGPVVLNALNDLLDRRYQNVLKGESTRDHEGRLGATMYQVRQFFGGWDRDAFEGVLRFGAFYHDIGKYIIKERHPAIGWYIAEYIDPDEKRKLRQVLAEREEYLQLLMITIRDHDQFGVLSTGEASYPILLGATSSASSPLEPQQVVSALMMCNLADMVGTFDVDGETIDNLISDWEWILSALEHCERSGENVSDYVVSRASDVSLVSKRIQRLLRESSRPFPERRKELNDPRLIEHALRMVFGNDPILREFARQFTRICKLDYGKRFFEALMEYCEGPRLGQNRKLPVRASKVEDRYRVVYSVLSILKRITTTYGVMLGSGSTSGNFIGVELKDLAPVNAPEKTARIIELILSQHYPGLTWMMADVPAWFF